MKTLGIKAVSCLLLCYPSLMAEPANRELPRLAEHLEDALSDATGAFVGTIEFSDVERLRQNIITGSVKLVAAETIWGRPISGPIELGHQRLILHGGSGRGLDIWVSVAHLMARNLASVPVLAVFREREKQTGLLYLQISQDQRCSRERADFQAILALRDEVPSEDFRNELLGIANAPGSAEVLWSYALRRLFLLGDDLEDRVANTLGSVLQKNGDAKRIHYALRLLVSNGLSSSVVQTSGGEHSEPQRKWLRGGPCDGRALRWRLLSVVESAPNGAVAFASAMALLNDDPASPVSWTTADIEQISDRINGALDNPARAAHSLGEAQQRAIREQLARFIANAKSER